MNAKIKPITSLTGITAIFVRGFVEAFTDGEQTLRGCQDAGLTLVQELGGAISVPYISKLSRSLSEAEIITRSKLGRNYIVGAGPNLEEFVLFLEGEEDYGTRLKGTALQDEQRGRAMDHLEEHGAILASYDDDARLPPAAFKMLMQMVKEEKLDIAFIKRDAVAGVKHNGTTHRIKPLS